MAETKRTLNNILTTILQDGQTANAITMQDIRDCFASVKQPFGSANLVANATATTIAVQNTFYTIAGTFTAGDLHEVTMAAGGIMTYTGTPNRHIHVVSNFDVSAASNAQVLSFQWFHTPVSTGIAVALDPPLNNKTATSTDVQALSLHADVEVANGDKLQLKITNTTSASNATVSNCYLFFQGMFM